MENQQKHVPGGHYSARNPVPNVSKFIENLDKDKKERDKKIDAQSKLRKRQKKSSQDDEVLPHVELRAGKCGIQKIVTDPVTGKEVRIEDVDKGFMKAVDDPQLSVPNANLNKPTPIKTDASQSNPEYKHNQDITAPPDPIAEGTTSDVPIHGEKTNILFHPTPSVSYEPMFQRLETRAGVLCAAIVFAIVVLGNAFGGSLWGLVPLSACVASAVWLWMKEVVRSGREVEWSSEQTRGETAVSNLLPESVEWMNSFLQIFWGLLNPDMFAAVADTLEDVMQASVPGIIENVRVADIDQGNNPIRILSLRALPDDHVRNLKDGLHEANKNTKDPQEAAADEEDGEFYNLEVSFAYHAKPSGKSAASKARNMHMQLVFYLGIKGLFGVPLPVFVELQSLVGTVRLRLQMTPQPPFLRNLTFTLMGLPHIQAGCVPMVQKGVNILNLPLISNFVNYAIGATANMYVAPKSMSIDVSAIVQGDDIQKDTDAMGVLWIRIHRATGLSKQDRRGSRGGGSDPYITLTFSKYGKPMYCTRVISDDLNPIWEETAALLVTPELIKADEQLSVELWDSDRSTADDIVGKIELSIQKMIQHPGKMYPQCSKLQGMHADSEMPGNLHWEVGYFGKPRFRPALRTDGKNKILPEVLRDREEFQDDKGVIKSETEDAVAHTPPDPLWPSGICSIVIHQIINLEFEDIKGTVGSRKGKEYEPAKRAGEIAEEQSKGLPSSYCTILFNDQLVYRTRFKAVSSQPIFNAGTERFIRDWRSAIVTVTVRDKRYRQHDPILGVVPLKLTDVLDTSSQVTRWYPLDGGIGFGRIRISLLWRSVETKLPPNILGWDVGTFEILSNRVTALNYASSAKLKLRTGGSTGSIPRTDCCKADDSQSVYWETDKKEGKPGVRLPVKYRYRSPVVFEFHVNSRRGASAYAVLWLHHLVDNETTDIDIPIWTTKNGPRLTQNYVTEENIGAKAVPGLEDLTQVGRLKFGCRFKAGMDEDHENFIFDNDSRETFETWEACLAEGVRQRQVDSSIPEKLRELHENSLVEGRGVALKRMASQERQRWIGKDGTDWSGAFGHDPGACFEDGNNNRKSAGPGASSESDSGSSSAAQEPAAGCDTDVAAAAAAASGGAPSTTADADRMNKRTQARRHRGLQQWKPMRNVTFAKDEVKLGARRVRNRLFGSLAGREPGIETETGT